MISLEPILLQETYSKNSYHLYLLSELEIGSVYRINHVYRERNSQYKQQSPFHCSILQLNPYLSSQSQNDSFLVHPIKSIPYSSTCLLLDSSTILPVHLSCVFTTTDVDLSETNQTELNSYHQQYNHPEHFYYYFIENFFSQSLSFLSFSHSMEKESSDNPLPIPFSQTFSKSSCCPLLSVEHSTVPSFFQTLNSSGQKTSNLFSSLPPSDSLNTTTSSIFSEQNPSSQDLSVLPMDDCEHNLIHDLSPIKRSPSPSTNKKINISLPSITFLYHEYISQLLNENYDCYFKSYSHYSPMMEKRSNSLSSFLENSQTESTISKPSLQTLFLSYSTMISLFSSFYSLLDPSLFTIYSINQLYCLSTLQSSLFSMNDMNVNLIGYLKEIQMVTATQSLCSSLPSNITLYNQYFCCTYHDLANENELYVYYDPQSIHLYSQLHSMVLLYHLVFLPSISTLSSYSFYYSSNSQTLRLNCMLFSSFFIFIDLSTESQSLLKKNMKHVFAILFCLFVY